MNKSNSRKITQTQQVLEIMKERGCIDPMVALREVGCFRLAARIHKLRKQGHNITSRRITKKGRFGKVSFAEYHLKEG